jgi:hypothetical protein
VNSSLVSPPFYTEHETANRRLLRLHLSKLGNFKSMNYGVQLPLQVSSNEIEFDIKMSST